MHLGFAESTANLVDFDHGRTSLIMHRNGLESLPGTITGRFDRIAAFDAPDGGDADGYERNDAIVLELAEQTVTDLGRPTAIVGLFENTVVPAARLREHFGIPGMSMRTAVRCRDKVAMKAAVRYAGVRVPEFREVGPHTDPAGLAAIAAAMPGRVVLKPRRQAASIGISIFDSGADFLRHARSAGLPDDYQVEQFVDGSICHFDGVVRDGRIRFFSASKYLDDCTCFAFQFHDAPLATVTLDSPRIVADARHFTESVLDAVELRHGVFHLEAFITPDGHFVFLEIAARFGGAGIVKQLEQAYGVDLIEETLLACLGKPSRVAVETRPSAAAHGLLLMPIGRKSKCVVRRIRGLDRCPESVVWSDIPNIAQILEGGVGVYVSGGKFVLAGDSTESVIHALGVVMDSYAIDVDDASE